MTGTIRPRTCRRASLARRGLWLVLPALLVASAATAQEKPEAAPAPPAEQSRPLPGSESGFIGAVGRFFERSLAPVTPKQEPAQVEAAAQPVEVPPPEAAAPVPAVAPPAAARTTNPLEIPGELAKGAIDAVTKLPSSVGLPNVGLPSSVVTGRERCIVAANGAPDCLAATEVLCKRKGFSAGNSVDIQTAQRCKAHVWLGAAAQPSDCTTESFVTRAVCR